MTPRELPEPVDNLDRQLLGWVAEFGWAVLGIPDDAEGPGYTFSIGLWRGWGHPEIVLFGLNHESAHRLINDLGTAIKAGATFEAGQRYDGLVPGYPAFFLAVDAGHVSPYLGYACWFNRGDDFPALQCVWPDRERRFPWEAGFDERFRSRQPLLGPAPRIGGLA